MQRREPPTPAAQIVLDEIVRQCKPGAVVTLGKIARSLDQHKNTLAHVLNRLEAGGWISRPKHRSGCPRAISVVVEEPKPKRQRAAARKKGGRVK
jgi:hypothetical protein